MTKEVTNYSNPARTRMAPSPTGEYHVGHLRTILFNLALSKKTKGQFIIRIEDTDTKRYVVGAVDKILDVISDYGLSWDEGPRVGGPYGPYIQSERFSSNMYKEAANSLVQKGHAYKCFCTEQRLSELRISQQNHGKPSGYDKHCRNLSLEQIESNLSSNIPYTIRIQIPSNTSIELHDFLRGKITWNSNDVEDYIILKSDGIPTYHLASVVDDHEMQVTHILRGQDWIPTAPVLVLLYKFLEWDQPVIIHTPNVLDPTGKGKMSKRRSGEKAFARYYLDKGYPPQAMLNYLMFLGWSHPDEKVNILSLEDFINVFSLERIQPQDSRWDFEKIDWYGGQYIRSMDLDNLYENILHWLMNVKSENMKLNVNIWKDRIRSEPVHFKNILRLLHDRLRKYSEIFELAEFFYSKPVSDIIDWEKTKHTQSECIGAIPGLKSELSNNLEEENWTQEKWESCIRSYADICGWKQGDMFMLVRLCIVGSPFSPNLLDSMNLIGSKECLSRFDFVL